MKAWRIGAMIGLLICGCGRAAAPKSQTLPVKGTVTLDGKPLSGANVVFLVADPPAAFVGTTKDNGTYELQGAEGRAASLRGNCKVTVSRMVKPDGSRLAPGEMPAMVFATEELPPKYSRLDSTVLMKTVPAEGGTFDFALESK
ncbi:MAG TPA: hypothetical protein VGN42_07585 [Pirellulales bacterium]|nr:hypothetical protein [Pirellulales bacterium]